jgi:hypothetical protein
MANPISPRQEQQTKITQKLGWRYGLAGLVALAVILLMTQTQSGGGPSGFVGPAGIGDGTSNNFWYEFSVVAQADGTTVGGVADRSGNGNNLSASGTAQPIFQDNPTTRIHGKPVLAFDGVNDRLNLPNAANINIDGPYEEKTIAIAFRTSTDISSQQFLFDEGGTIRGLNIYLEGGKLYFTAYNEFNDDAGATTPWAFQSVQANLSTETAYLAMLVYDYPNDLVSAYLNGSLAGSFSGVGKLFTHGDVGGIGGINSDSRDHEGTLGNPVDKRYFQGEILEVVGYNAVLNTAQRLILENYFGAKFDLSIADDRYAYQATHSYELAGLWSEVDGSTHEDARGTAQLRIYNPDDLDPGEGLLWAHDGIELSRGNSTDVDQSVDIQSRLARSWRFSVAGTPGLVSISIDVSDITKPTPSNFRLLIERSGDDFRTADVAPISGTYDAGTQTITFSNVALQDGDWVTLGSTGFTFPVEFVSFEAEIIGQEVQLSWSTATEVNNDFFAIERSGDGQIFDQIGREAGAGNSQQIQSYAFTDAEPLPRHAYYRLKQVDYDGTYAFSTVQEVLMSAELEVPIVVFPNPVAAGEIISIQLESQREAEVEAVVTNLAGQVVAQQTFSVLTGQNILSFSSAALSAGTYVMQIKNGQTSASQRFSVQ